MVDLGGRLKSPNPIMAPRWGLALTAAVCLVVSFGQVSLALASAAIDPDARSGIIRLGVLAHRASDQVIEAWQPLLDDLNSSLPAGFTIELMPGNFSQIDQMVQSASVDLVLTNPSHFIQLRAGQPQMRALSTIVEERQGILLSGYGGVMIAAANRSRFQTLDDLQSARIAAVSPASLGGYQAQLHELHRAGVPRPRDANIQFTDMPYSQVVEAVLSGQADVGFVRTSVLEMMAAQEGLDLSELRVINPRQHVGFPFLVSTALYPQWVLAALPDVTIESANLIAITLLSMSDTAPTAHGDTRVSFTVAVDYSPVEQLARELRLPPFDVTPEFSLGDVIYRYPIQSAIYALLAALLILSMLTMVIFNRRLAVERLRASSAAERYDLLVSELPVGIYELTQHPDDSIEVSFVSGKFCRMLGVEPAQARADFQSLFKHLHPEDLERVKAENSSALQRKDSFQSEFRVRVDELECWLMAESWPRAAPDGSTIWTGSLTDVTGRREMQQRFRVLFEHSPLSIMLHDAKTGEVMDANPAAWRSYGLDSLDELLNFDLWMNSRKLEQEGQNRLGLAAQGIPSGSSGPAAGPMVNYSGRMSA
jgi:ABC-type phosphate/phosphonate transport system substrate-binding protein